jgi:hypothetical protein
MPHKPTKDVASWFFEPEDWVWLYMRKERFPAKRRSKLLPRGDGPFHVLEHINDNAYKLDLPGEYNVSATSFFFFFFFFFFFLRYDRNSNLNSHTRIF